MEKISALSVHPSIRLFCYPDQGEGSLRLVHLESKRTFDIADPIVVRILLEACQGEKFDAADLFPELEGTAQERIHSIINWLLNNDILTNAPPTKSTTHLDKFSSFVAQQSTDSALDYLLLTCDYPFFDYAVDGFTEDRRVMKEYSEEQEDTERFKTYEVPPNHVIEAATPSSSLATTPFGQTQGPVTSLEFKKLFPLIFGIRATRDPGWPGAAPLIMRTSPSGGSRQPTEAYLALRRESDLKAGVYHFNFGKNEFCLLDKPESLNELFEASGTLQADALVILTSVFSRNMYRYREPKTFRAIHADVGHLVSNLEMVLSAYGVKTECQFDLDIIAIDDLLGLSPFKESAFCSVAINLPRANDNG